MALASEGTYSLRPGWGGKAEATPLQSTAAESAKQPILGHFSNTAMNPRAADVILSSEPADTAGCNVATACSAFPVVSLFQPEHSTRHTGT